MSRRSYLDLTNSYSNKMSGSFRDEGFSQHGLATNHPDQLLWGVANVLLTGVHRAFTAGSGGISFAFRGRSGLICFQLAFIDKSAGSGGISCLLTGRTNS